MGYGNQKTLSFAGETQGKSVRKVEKNFLPKYTCCILRGGGVIYIE
jgi:hypothetical protein